MKKIIFTIMLLFVFSAYSYAQEEEVEVEKIFPDSGDVAPEMLASESRNEVTDIPDSTIIKDKYAGKYQATTVQNLSKLYWMKGILDISNDLVIDNFIRINECDIYNKNIKNDFKWLKVRKAARQMIKEQVPTYSDKFQVVIPVDLGPYDIDKKGFPLINDTAFNDFQRIEVNGNRGNVCGEKREIGYFPREARLILNKPLNYNFVGVDEHLAQAYVIRNNKEKPVIPKELRVKPFNRLAFARVRMVFMESQGLGRGINRAKVAVMFGKIEGIEIFENFDETGLLASTDL